MTIRDSHARRVAGIVTLTALLLSPATLRAQHATPAHPPKQSAPAAAPAATSAPSQAAKPGSFNQLQAALDRIQKRVTATVGASSVPQTALTTPPKPPKPADAPKPADPPKPADASKAPVADAPKTPADSSKPAEASKAPAAAAKPLPRIHLNWRSTLVWPKEIAPPPPTPSSGRIGLIWK